jgi:hypothetical protein
MVQKRPGFRGSGIHPYKASIRMPIESEKARLRLKIKLKTDCKMETGYHKDFKKNQTGSINFIVFWKKNGCTKQSTD